MTCADASAVLSAAVSAPYLLGLILAPVAAAAFVIQTPQLQIRPRDLFPFQADSELYPLSGNEGPSLRSSTLNEENSSGGAGTFGDIMAGSSSRVGIKDCIPSAAVDGLVTKAGGELNARFKCNFSPMERIALTANGNLQRIFSSYYDAPVHIHVESCSRRKACTNGEHVPQILLNHSELVSGDAVWDRIVRIKVLGKTTCKATSIISVKTPMCIRLIENGSVGLGQMFRYLNKLPTFSLLDAGKTTPEANELQGGMWRTYELRSEEMTCLIHEEFRSDAWDIESKTSDQNED